MGDKHSRWKAGEKVKTAKGYGLITKIGKRFIFVRLDWRNDSIPFYPWELAKEAK